MATSDLLLHVRGTSTDMRENEDTAMGLLRKRFLNVDMAVWLIACSISPRK